MTEEKKPGIPLIPSMEAVIPLLLENYCRNDINGREKMLQEIFVPMARAHDKLAAIIKTEKENNND